MAVKGMFYVRLFVSDLERSKRFYRDSLGWRLDTDVPGVAGLWFGDAYVVLHEDSRPAAERIYGGGMTIEVKVDDIEVERTNLEGHAVGVSAIREQPWGERQFEFEDPDGYPWMYGQATR